MTRIRLRATFVICVALFLASQAEAGGVYLYELGTPDAGLAAAGWAARAQDPSTVFTNPAGMTRLQRSALQVGAQPLSINLEFNPDSKTTTSGKDGDASTWLPAGSLFYVYSLTPDLKVGLGAFGYFGLGLEYEDDWVGRYYVQEVTLQAVGLQPAVAYRVTDWLSLGVGFVGLYGVLEQKAAVNNIDPDLDDGRLKLKDEDWAYQVNAGVLLEPRDGTRFGLTYLSEGELEFSDKPNFKGLGPGLEAILGSAGLLDSKLDVDFNLPQSIMFSAYHEITKRLAILGNVSWQDWSRFGKVDVAVTAEDTTSLTVDRKYQDTWHVAAGAQYRVSDVWLVSGGVAYDSSLVDDEDRTPDLPLGEQWRLGLGTRYDWSSDLTVSAAYTLAWAGDLDMDVNRGPLAGRVSGTYENAALHFLNINLNWAF